MPGPVFVKSGYTLKPSKKRAPRAITLSIVVTSISYPFISPSLRDNDPQAQLPAANEMLRRVQVQFGYLTSDWDKVLLGSGCQSPGIIL